MKNIKMISFGIILILLIGIIIIYKNGVFDKNNDQMKENNFITEDGNVILSTSQIEQIDTKLKENSCEMVILFLPLVEIQLDFQDFETRISSIRNYLHGKQLSGKLSRETDEIIWRDLGDIVSYNTLVRMDVLEDYHQRLFKEDLDKSKLDPEKIYEEKYYDTGIVPDGGCLPYVPVLNKIKYDKQKDVYTMFIVDAYPISEIYQKEKQLTDEEIEKNGLKEKLSYLKISFKWKNDQIILLSSES